MNPFSFPRIDVPLHWTGDEAAAVVEFLDEISAAIWEIHEERIFAVMKRDRASPERAASDDDFPF